MYDLLEREGVIGIQEEDPLWDKRHGRSGKAGVRLRGQAPSWRWISRLLDPKLVNKSQNGGPSRRYYYH